MTTRPTRTSSTEEPVARLVDQHAGDFLDVLGAAVQFVTPPEAEEGAPCVLRGTIPPRGVVPLHSHADPETFIAVSGAIEGLVHSGDACSWVRVDPGDIFHVPGHAKHAWRNDSDDPPVSIIVTTARIGRFFREIGAPLDPGEAPADPPSVAAVRHFLETAERYGYWNATPEENAEVGLVVPAPE